MQVHWPGPHRSTRVLALLMASLLFERVTFVFSVSASPVTFYSCCRFNVLTREAFLVLHVCKKKYICIGFCGNLFPPQNKNKKVIVAFISELQGKRVVSFTSFFLGFITRSCKFISQNFEGKSQNCEMKNNFFLAIPSLYQLYHTFFLSIASSYKSI